MAKEFLQVYGLDYHESFAIIAKVATTGLNLALLEIRNDMSTNLILIMLFLHGRLEEELYLISHQGLEVPVGKICKLSTTLYGLKQLYYLIRELLLL